MVTKKVAGKKASKTSKKKAAGTAAALKSSKPPVRDRDKDLFKVAFGTERALTTNPPVSNLFLQTVKITAKIRQAPANRKFEWDATNVLLSHPTDTLAIISESSEDTSGNDSAVTFEFLRVKPLVTTRRSATLTDDDIVVTIQTSKKKGP